jgi:hypothetical protein
MTAQGRPGTTYSSLHQSRRWFISNHTLSRDSIKRLWFYKSKYGQNNLVSTKLAHIGIIIQLDPIYGLYWLI